MAVVRTNPLPIGRYWLDVFDPMPDGSAGTANMLAWLAQNVGRVKVLSTESFATTPHRNWYLFQVLAQPTAFPFVQLGFPTIAAPNIQHSDDTVQKPPAETISIPALGLAISPAVLILAGVALFALSQSSRR